MDPIQSDLSANGKQLYLCTLIIVFAAGHVVIGMLRGARSWRALATILLALVILFALLARLP